MTDHNKKIVSSSNYQADSKQRSSIVPQSQDQNVVNADFSGKELYSKVRRSTGFNND